MSFSNDQPALESQLPLSIELPDDPKDFRNRVNDLYQKTTSSLNSKIGGLYQPLERTTGGQYFDRTNVQKNRNIYRMTVDFGTLPNTSTKSVPHNIPGWNNNYRLVQSYGAASDPDAMEYLPIPNNGILLEINSIDVTITTTSDRSSFTDTTVVIEYLKVA